MTRRASTYTAAILSASVLALATPAFSQDTNDDDEVVVTGIRQALENALVLEREAASLTEVILSEDIGKLPDQNLAEVLENVTGVQITRTAGVGTGVQIRGTNANRVEINGVSTVGSGSGRSGINFEDVNPSIIAGVEVIKAPEAKTIEGSVGGTVNLRTIRPLDLDEDDVLATVRVQGEYSDLSTAGIKPRVSGALGKKWTNLQGQEIGVVLSGSYTEQEATSFRPRVDRDNVASPEGAVPPEFLGIQFFVQEQENFDYETINFAGTIEAKPSDAIRLYFDAIVNDQERAQDSYRLQASGVSSFRNSSIPTAFEIVDFGVGPGQFPAALAGTINRRTPADDNPNLRTSTDTGARVTNTNVFTLGADWDITDRATVRAQWSNSSSDTNNPNLSSTLNFINPNTNLVARVQEAGNNSTRTNVALIGDVQTLADAIASVDGADTGFIYNDNSTPFIYDLSDRSLAFGVNFANPDAPTSQQLLDFNNYVLDQVIVGNDTTENSEDAIRFDASYDLEGMFGDFLSSVDVGYRRSKSRSEFNDVEDRIGGFTRLQDSPNAALFSNLLVAGPDNFGDADDRSLFISDFLLVDPNLSFSDPDGTLAALQGAVIQNDPGSPDILNLRRNLNAFYDVEETTDAFYAQANFDYGMFRGNVGLRYIETEIDSTAFGPEVNGERQLQTTPGEYNFWLPRINLIAEPVEDVVLRAAYGKDIRRPNFNTLNTAFTFNQSENSVVALGNPGLEPEEVDSFDISADWYFAPAAVFSIGYFYKERTNIFGIDFDGALLVPDPSTVAGNARETDPNCPGGGIFNPIVIPNQFGDPTRPGLCVDATRPGNDPEETTQQGIEVSLQYALSDFEDRMGSFGWASGFGFLANYTYQEFGGGSVIDTTSGRGLNVLGDVSIPRGLLDFSKNAYNLTAFYEKYGLSARVRYTWREAFRTQDFGGGANTSGSSTFSFPVVTDDRGQLNASVNYDVTDQLTVGVEGVNLTKSNIYQNCVSSTGPLCFAGFPDRRITFGATYRF